MWERRKFNLFESLFTCIQRQVTKDKQLIVCSSSVTYTDSNTPNIRETCLCLSLRLFK